MSKHTPGPWNFYDDSNDGKTNRIEIVAIGKTVAKIYHSVPDEDLPNARLIAAAPEMYGLLKDVKQALRYFFEMNHDRLKPPALWHIEKINEVLNKIEGANE